MKQIYQYTKYHTCEKEIKWAGIDIFLLQKYILSGLHSLILPHMLELTIQCPHFYTKQMTLVKSKNSKMLLVKFLESKLK